MIELRVVLASKWAAWCVLQAQGAACLVPESVSKLESQPATCSRLCGSSSRCALCACNNVKCVEA
ncbi:hypothetical protein JG687_00012511 [Phytophthora cactorum]|uniref:Secreted protein n=1 Tax=Phytophthora cactorum TaxID=29920 RepID=A0A329RRU2_9STRA|nr:hypothetical protein Pcac1_g13366 [Phytophthora cactorum]KAG2810538.1 hypothetical protein PC111_g15612 [Phytophthora cactorum]KAG2811472.1 hypothetical protein PC112_g15585 [Phytophthora cactorum]KAG2851696.1 hypothetical protein PC113_g15681 [Phytophthora cactorum]KAG2890774.1 hypothetical protein PC114_g17290 [Phytophthora cactorum]